MGDIIQGQHNGSDSKEIKNKKYKLKFLRKVLHSFSGVLALVFYFFPHQENIFAFSLAILIIVSLLFDALRLTFVHINEFVFKYLSFLFVERDKHKINSAIFYYGSCLLTIKLFPVDIAAIAILYLSVGDTAAALGGIYFSRWIPYRIPKTSKTFIGSFFFVLVSMLIGLIFGLSLKVAFLSALTGAIFEALPLGIDDNFTIPLSSSLVIWLFTI